MNPGLIPFLREQEQLAYVIECLAESISGEAWSAALNLASELEKQPAIIGPASANLRLAAEIRAALEHRHTPNTGRQAAASALIQISRRRWNSLLDILEMWEAMAQAEMSGE